MPEYRNINIRLTPEEAELVDEFQARLQAKYGSEIRVTQRTVIVQALKYFARTLEEQEKHPEQETQHKEKPMRNGHDVTLENSRAISTPRPAARSGPEPLKSKPK